MGSSWTDRRLVATVSILLYCWLFLAGEEERAGPEDLAEYRGDLAAWVHGEEETLRAVQDGRRKQVVDVCKKYGVDGRSKEVAKEARALKLEPEEWSYLKRVNW
jgi:hypothetical protein